MVCLLYTSNSQWLLHVGDIQGAEKNSFSDKDWKKVTLPHAFNEDEAFKVGIENMTDTVSWYRKHFKLPKTAKGKKVFIEFEGVRQGADFYVNGNHIGLHENGVMAVGFDLTSYLNFGGENVIAVRTDNDWNYKERATGSKMCIRDRHNFVSRNRIVAGMCDATVVIESAEKGGSLITAELAEGYHRDCFAFPGRINDEYSKGCNRLIRDNKASLLLSAEDLVQAMGWNIPTTSSEKVNVQRSLFLDLSEEEQKIVSILEKQGNLQINSLVVEADIPVHKINAILFELEMKGVVRVLAGGMYQLLN